MRFDSNMFTGKTPRVETLEARQIMAAHFKDGIDNWSVTINSSKK
ncbi:MAG TPA: hypothetical protein VIM11_09575 [Tepidisphaeraceae bacterium]|jgi:hypothetical protein